MPTRKGPCGEAVMSGRASCTGSRAAARRDRTGRRHRRDRRASRRARSARSLVDGRHKRRDDALAVGLADDPEAHRRRDQVRHERQRGRPRASPTAARHGRPPRRRPPPDRRHRRARPAAAGRWPRTATTRAPPDEGVALRGRLETPLAARRQARAASSAMLGHARRRRRPRRPVGRGEQDGVVARRAMREEIARASPRRLAASRTSPASCAHSSPCE